MNRQKAWEDLIAILDNTEDSIKLYRNGRKNAYRSTAVGLNTLLCDENSVLLRIFPQARLHSLNGFAAKLTEKQSYLLKDLAFSPPGKLVFDGKGNAQIQDLFYKGQLLPINQWLTQPLINQKITIKEFIKSIADKEGKHSDPDYNDTLKLTKPVSLASKEMNPELIVTIGEYVIGLVRHVTATFFTKDEVEKWMEKKT